MTEHARMRGHGSAADLRRFEAVDEAPDPEILIRSLDTGKALHGMRAVEADMLAELDLRQARSALDVGCGLGADVVSMSSRMAPGGLAVGLDASRTMIATARGRVGGGLPGVSFVAGNAMAMPFADAVFDACRTETVLQHVSDPQRTVCEMARVTRPGGRIVAFEFDLGLTVLDHPDRATTRKIFDTVADAALDGWLGRQLPRFFRQAGLAGLRVSTRVIFNDLSFFRFVMRRPVARLIADGVLSARQATRWLAELEQSDRAGHYLGGSTAFLVSATKGVRVG
jgi:ubiquinone/menaquinone biosynthesis C-methylase UbiE